MKVDFPQPESAASPITMGVSPSFKAFNEDDLVARRLAGMKAVVVVATRAPAMIESFMVYGLLEGRRY